MNYLALNATLFRNHIQLNMSYIGELRRRNAENLEVPNFNLLTLWFTATSL